MHVKDSSHTVHCVISCRLSESHAISKRLLIVINLLVSQPVLKPVLNIWHGFFIFKNWCIFHALLRWQMFFFFFLSSKGRIEQKQDTIAEAWKTSTIFRKYNLLILSKSKLYLTVGGKTWFCSLPLSVFHFKGREENEHISLSDMFSCWLQRVLSSPLLHITVRECTVRPDDASLGGWLLMWSPMFDWALGFCMSECQWFL